MEKKSVDREIALAIKTAKKHNLQGGITDGLYSYAKKMRETIEKIDGDISATEEVQRDFFSMYAMVKYCMGREKYAYDVKPESAVMDSFWELWKLYILDSNRAELYELRDNLEYARASLLKVIIKRRRKEEGDKE
jgi:hypothetical protein